MSPALSELTDSLLSMAPSTTELLSLSSSLANSPDMHPDPSLEEDAQEEDSDFIVLTLDIKVSPADSLISASMDSLVFIPSITLDPDPEPCIISHIPHAPSDSSHVVESSFISDPLSFTSISSSSSSVHNISPLDSDSTNPEPMLSTLISEQIDTSDCYLGMNDNIIDLRAITDSHMESQPFLAQVSLYSPGAKTLCF